MDGVEIGGHSTATLLKGLRVKWLFSSSCILDGQNHLISPHLRSTTSVAYPFLRPDMQRTSSPLAFYISETLYNLSFTSPHWPQAPPCQVYILSWDLILGILNAAMTESEPDLSRSGLAPIPYCATLHGTSFVS